MATYQGNEVGYDFAWTVEDCQKLCEENKMCNSITYRMNVYDELGTCSLRDKCLTDSERFLELDWDGEQTYYKDCNGNFFN